MTVYPSPRAIAAIAARVILTLERRRYELLLQDGVEHAHRVVETINEPWLYREVTT